MQNIVGQNIRKRRLQLQLTQLDLAYLVGVTSKAAISRVENGVEDLTTDRIRKYAKALKCSPSDLMGWNTDSQLNRLMAYSTKLQAAYDKASEKDKKAVCAILEIDYEDNEVKHD